MGKLISNIQNYPLSEGSVAYSNRLLLDDSAFSIQTNSLKDYFKIQLEFAKDIYFFNDLGTNTNRWNELLQQSAVFQFSRFLTISAEELNTFFTNLPQSNGFNSDIELTQDEYETLAYQRLQIIQYLFWFYKTIGQTIQDESQAQIHSILKSDPIGKLFVQFQSLADECLFLAPILLKIINRKNIENFNEIAFSDVEKDFIDTLNSYFNPTNLAGNQVLTIYSNKFDKIKAANEYANSIFQNLLKIHQTFSYWANKKIEELANYTNTHQPHISLLIAFCKLKMLYDARYNQLIHSHTYFIFNDILQLKKQPVLPDTAFVNIELAKNINSFLVEKNSLFKAGKNAENKQVYYQASQDLVLNGAKISQIKSTVRAFKNGELFTVCGTDDAANAEWQVNDAWLPFNDLAETFTGIALESKLLLGVEKKDTIIDFEFEFDKNVPEGADLADKFTAAILLEDNSEEILKIENVVIDDHLLKISAKLEKDVKNIKNGINARLKLISPSKNEQNDELFVVLYKYLLSEQLGKIKVKISQTSFAPITIDTTAGTIDGKTSFAAFGSQSLAGSSFRIQHPFILFAKNIDLKVDWAETLKDKFSVKINGHEKAHNVKWELSEFDAVSEYLRVKLEDDITYTVSSKINSTKIESTLPRVLIIKKIDLIADLEEVIYEKENKLPIRYTEIFQNSHRFIRSLRIPYTNKTRQKIELHKRHVKLRMRFKLEHRNKLLAHLYPLGEQKVDKSTGLTFLPDYSVQGFSDFEGDLCIGLTNILPNQSISLLFEIADETAEQSELEAKISWYFLSENNFLALDKTKIFDSTNNFLQSGIVQFTLPETATDDNTAIYGSATYWLVARCDKNSQVVANIKAIKTNGLAVIRLFDTENQEAKKSVAPATIENIYPKTANIKSVTQNTPSQNGREIETDQHYFWRSSQRLRHKQRAVNQWDYEQMVLEKFSNIYKVKCLNHANYNAENQAIYAKSTNTVVSLIPHYRINISSVNFQPAIPLSKLLEIKSYLLTKTSAFNQLQVLNSQWDEVKIELEATLNKNILDLVFYQEKLNSDLKIFLSPWAFESSTNPRIQSKIYVATLVDYIDELPYVHHINSLKIYKNEIEVFDEIKASTEIHFLTSASDHIVTVYDN